MDTVAPYQEMVQDIRNFIEEKKEPNTIIQGYVESIDSKINIAAIKLLEKFNFYRGAIVLVDNLSGTITDAYDDKINVEFRKTPNQLLKTNVNIDTSLINIIMDRLNKTVLKIEKNELDDYNQKILNFLIKKGNPSYNNLKPYNSAENLNQSQREAIEQCLAADDFHLIMGPPGTGKTSVIKHLIQESVQFEDKLLLTAWSNAGVDNVLERLEDIDEDLIVRIGPLQSISPAVSRYSIHEKRERHPLWKDVIGHDKAIKKAYDDIRIKRSEFASIGEGIKQINKEKRLQETEIEELKKAKKKFLSRASQFKQVPQKRSVELKIMEEKFSKNEKKSERYVSLSRDIFQLEKIEKGLPDPELYYELESEIEKMNKKKFWKRLTSIFNSKRYHEFLDELNDKKTVYKKITEKYAEYWKFRDKVVTEYNTIYPSGHGNPDDDAVALELELLEIMKKSLPHKTNEFQWEMDHDKNKLIYESYTQYINSLDINIKTVQEKIKNLETEIRLITDKKERISLEIENISQTIEKHKDDQKNLIGIIEDEIIEGAKLIATTVISSAQYLLDQQEYDMMIMDEASQVASFMSIIPMLKCKKFVLVGDHKQLQPITEEKLKANLNLSIFNRLVNMYPENYTFLDTQYRMNQQISDISSELFYEGKLKTYPPISKQTLKIDTHSPLINPNSPLTFIDTNGMEYFEEGIGSGCENIKEAQITTNIVQELAGQMDADEIGVITPYTKQKRRISRLLDNMVEVDTVHRFQGREKDVIILSFCNSRIGLLSRFIKKKIYEPSLINVALTRARKKLIIVGNSKTLKQSMILKDVIKRMGKENTVVYKEYFN